MRLWTGASLSFFLLFDFSWRSGFIFFQYDIKIPVADFIVTFAVIKAFNAACDIDFCSCNQKLNGFFAFIHASMAEMAFSGEGML